MDAHGNSVSQAAQDIAFINTYEADPAGIWISGIKTLTNETPGVTHKEMAVGAGKYFFRLTAVNGAPLAAGNTSGYEVVTNDADGKFAFGAIHFTKVGTYEYIITEDDTTVAGVSKDTAVHTVKVTVEEKAGQLIASITYDDTAVTGNAVETAFHNTYTAAPIDTGILLSGSKTIVGRWNLEQNQFKFTLRYPDGSTETVGNDKYGAFQFSAQKYNTVGTYTYRITEENTKIPGFTYDNKQITLVVKVEDNGEGQLIAKVGDVQIFEGYDVGDFKNIYVEPSVTVNLTGQNDEDGVKLLDDKTSQTDKTLEDFEFQFVLTDEAGEEIETVTDNNGTGFNFTDITYKEPCQKIYYIYEKAGMWMASPTILLSIR